MSRTKGSKNKTYRGQPVQTEEERKEWQRAHRKRYRDRLRRQVYEAYGNRCSCCGESNYGFLTVDHINNDGAEHRRKVNGGTSVLLDIIRRNFPPEFTILCFNCNAGRQWNGGVCPHEEARKPPS